MAAAIVSIENQVLFTRAFTYRTLLNYYLHDAVFHNNPVAFHVFPSGRSQSPACPDIELGAVPRAYNLASLYLTVAQRAAYVSAFVIKCEYFPGAVKYRYFPPFSLNHPSLARLYLADLTNFY